MGKINNNQEGDNKSCHPLDYYLWKYKKDCPAAFEEQHRAELAVYEAACAYFKANGLRTLPDLKKLDAEYQTLSSEKNGFYTRYKKAQIELRELRTAQQNVETFFRKEERNHAVPQQEVK